MLLWSKSYKTNIDVIDAQHQDLFKILNELVINVEQENFNNEDIDTAIKFLLHYTENHFNCEKLIMSEHRIDTRHFSKHIMEHKSFIYDVNHIMDLTSSYDRRIIGKVDKLVRFITFWLTYHTLGTDLLMADQITNIKLGMKPQQAFEALKDYKQDIVAVHMIQDALLNLWLDSKQRCTHLEKKTAELENKIEAIQSELEFSSLNRR